MSVGRPKKTLADLPEDWKHQLIELGKAGKSQRYMATELGMTHDLFYRFKADYPEFSDTVSEALGHSEQWWENVGQEGMFMGGKDNPFNATVYTFNMKNRFNWADKQENKTDITSGGEKLNMTVNFVKTD